MLIISHRGNLEGRDPATENDSTQVIKCLGMGFHVEVDVRYEYGQLYLGHDTADYTIDIDFLEDEHIWCHAKNIEALEVMLKHKGINCFGHNHDKYVVTSNGYIWTAVNGMRGDRVIVVTNDLIQGVAGICTDYPKRLEWDTGSDE